MTTPFVMRRYPFVLGEYAINDWGMNH